MMVLRIEKIEKSLDFHTDGRSSAACEWPKEESDMDPAGRDDHPLDSNDIRHRPPHE